MSLCSVWTSVVPSHLCPSIGFATSGVRGGERGWAVACLVPTTTTIAVNPHAVPRRLGLGPAPGHVGRYVGDEGGSAGASRVG